MHQQEPFYQADMVGKGVGSPLTPINISENKVEVDTGFLEPFNST